MKKISILLLCLFLTHLQSYAQSKNGVIKGTIQSEDNTPLVGINVSLEGTSLGNATDNNGAFTIHNVPPGRYTLLASGIGYSATKQDVQVDAGKTTQLNLQLNEATQSLQEIVVSAGYENYLEKTSSSSLRSDIPLIETPQTVLVISGQIMKDQQAQNLNDVTKNMTGVINNNMYTSYTMRGFSNYYPNSFITFDGFIGNMYQWSQMVQLYNIERVELIAGPASALFSVGTPGGVMNMVTKRPLETKRYSLNATFGSWNLIDVSADLGGPLSKDKKLLYRLNVGYNTGNSFRPYQFNRNLVIAPSLTYRFNDRTDVNLDYVYAFNKAKFAYDRGGLVFMNTDSTYNFGGALSTFVHNSPADYSTINTHFITLRVNHKLNDKTTITYLSRYKNTEFDMGEHYGVYYGDNYITELTSLDRHYDTWLYKPYNFQNSLFTSTVLGNKEFSHKVVAGVDYQLYGDRKNNYIDGPAPALLISNPDYSQDDFGSYVIDENTFVQDDKESTWQLGGYIQYILSYKNKLNVLIAGRYDAYHSVIDPLSDQNYTQESNESDADAFLPRFGVVYNVTRNQSIYLSYCESFLPQTSNNKGSGGPFPPEKGLQYELGYKAQWFDNNLLTTISLYNIDYVNVLKPDLSDPTGRTQVAVPGVNSKGVEFTVQGNVRDVSIIGGYAYNDVAFSEGSPLGEKGDRYDNAPRHIANIWMKYTVPAASKLKGLSFGVGAKYVGDRVGSAANQHFLMPSYALLDGAISYAIRNFSLDLNGYNLLDKKYIIGGYYSDFQVPVGTPVNWKIGVRYTLL